MDRLTAPQGEFDLGHHPDRPGGRRAWDAADAFLLRHLDDLPHPGGSAGRDDGEHRARTGGTTDDAAGLVILNDHAGALAAALAAHRPVVVTDSYLAARAVAGNLAANGLDPDTVSVRSSLDAPPPRIDTLVFKVPKSLAQFEDQLIRLAPALHAGTRVVGAAMARHLHTSTLEVCERVVGATRTTRAEQKARLVLCDVDAARPRPEPGPPPTFTVAVDDLPEHLRASGRGLQVTARPGVFAGARLDRGTRLLLRHLPVGPHHRVVDLGCGQGVLAAAYAWGDPNAHVTAVDESWRAVASAASTLQATVGSRPGVTAVVGDGLFDLASGPAIEPGTVDLVLNNPPFHDDHAVGDATAWQMFTESRRALRPGGQLWVVANRHLGHHAKLARLFGSCTTVASDPKFVVLQAVAGGRPSARR